MPRAGFSPSRKWAAALLVILAAAAPLRAQCPDGSPPPCPGRAGPPGNSVAVLTFENVTRDTSTQYIAEGLADQIATRLGSVPRLKIVSRTSVRRLRNPEQMSVQQIGQALNAVVLVSGSIRAGGGRVRVNVEALRASSGATIWSDAYDRSGDDLVGIEEAIATQVAAGVAGRLSPQERRALGDRMTASGPAYGQFLRGNVLLSRRSQAALTGAIAAYRAATQADPQFADAFARLAYAYALYRGWGYSLSDTLLDAARAASDMALLLNARSSDAWMARGQLLTVVSFTVIRAEHRDDSLLVGLRAFRRAVQLDPRNPEAWHQYGSQVRAVSDSASLDALYRALALDPARAITYQDLATTYFLMGQSSRALAANDSAVALDPDGPFRLWSGVIRLALGDTAGALADARTVPFASYSQAILAAIAHDSAATAAIAVYARAAPCDDGTQALHQLLSGSREAAIQSFLACGASLWTRWNLRMPVFTSIAGDPRIVALRTESERILARARW